MYKYNKFLIECFINGKYETTLNAVFETKELAKNYIKLYLEGRDKCTYVVRIAEYFYN